MENETNTAYKIYINFARQLISRGVVKMPGKNGLVDVDIQHQYDELQKNKDALIEVMKSDLDKGALEEAYKDLMSGVTYHSKVLSSVHNMEGKLYLEAMKQVMRNDVLRKEVTELHSSAEYINTNISDENNQFIQDVARTRLNTLNKNKNGGKNH